MGGGGILLVCLPPGAFIPAAKLRNIFNSKHIVLAFQSFGRPEAGLCCNLALLSLSQWRQHRVQVWLWTQSQNPVIKIRFEADLTLCVRADNENPLNAELADLLLFFHHDLH